jgi:hypothetical protein
MVLDQECRNSLEQTGKAKGGMAFFLSMMFLGIIHDNAANVDIDKVGVLNLGYWKYQGKYGQT